MEQQRWTEVDEYLEGLLLEADDGLEAALRNSDAAGLPAHQLSPSQGKLLHLLACIQGARSILEIGTLAGYSSIWLARALPAAGHLITLELDPAHAAVATRNLEQAGLADRVEVQVGPAERLLSQLAEQGRGPFDLIFIDADKPSGPAYLEWALRLSRVGSLIVADNVVQGGAVADADSRDPSVRGVRALLAELGRQPRISATALQTVGCKGYDGLAIARVTAGP